jgi:hypothetical protein
MAMAKTLSEWDGAAQWYDTRFVPRIFMLNQIVLSAAPSCTPVGLKPKQAYGVPLN